MYNRSIDRIVALLVLSVSVCAIGSCGGATKDTPTTQVKDAEQKRYEIKLDRKLQPGIRKTTVLKESNSMEMMLGEQVIQSQKGEVQKEYVALAKALERDEDGNLSKGDFLVEKLLLARDGQEMALIDAPTLVNATRENDRTVFAIEAGSLSEQIKELLSSFITVDKKKSKIDDDDVFGNKTPQSVGAEWQMNADLAARDAMESGVPLVPGTLSGKSKLESIQVIDGEECLEIKAQFNGKIDGTTMVPNLPEGTTMQADIVATFFGLFPVNPEKHEIEQGQTVDITILATFVKDGQQITMKMVFHMEESNKYAHTQK